MRKRKLGKSGPDDLREVDRAASEIAVYGARYPENLARMVGR